MVESRRELLHTRQVACRGYRLGDDRWEIEGRMIDLKNFPIECLERDGRLPVGEPLHDISLTLIVDSKLRILSVKAKIEAAPFNQCANITESFQVLEGLSLGPGLNQHVKKLLGGPKGCTHIVELLGPIATTAFQTLWQAEGGFDIDSPAVDGLLDSCHTWARDAGSAAKLLNELRERSSAVNRIEDE